MPPSSPIPELTQVSGKHFLMILHTCSSTLGPWKAHSGVLPRASEFQCGALQGGLSFPSLWSSCLSSTVCQANGLGVCLTWSGSITTWGSNKPRKTDSCHIMCAVMTMSSTGSYVVSVEPSGCLQTVFKGVKHLKRSPRINKDHQESSDSLWPLITGVWGS